MKQTFAAGTFKANKTFASGTWTGVGTAPPPPSGVPPSVHFYVGFVYTHTQGVGFQYTHSTTHYFVTS